MEKIQIIAILISFVFLAYIAWLIVKGKLREEYAIVWIACTIVLIIFSVWRAGLDVMAKLIGVYSPPNLVFSGAILAILIYLLHLSVTVSRLQKQNKSLAQEIALLKEKMEKK